MILIQAKFEREKSLKTKRNLVFSTKQDIDELELMQLKSGEGYLAFNPDIYREKVMNIIKSKRIGVDEGEMTLSQRMRFVLWNVAEQMGVDFEQFYEKEMTKIIEHYKTKYL